MSSPEHAPAGDPCSKCKLPAARHRHRVRTGRVDTRKHRERIDDRKRERTIIAIDGEGWTDAKGRHRYVYMAACTEDELVSELRARDPMGLTFGEVARWLLDLPRGALLVGFALGYDKTKWLESLPNEAIYALTHPETRRGKRGIRPVKVQGFRVNMVSTHFSVRADEDDGNGTRSVWDFFKFFQCAFVKALTQWGIGTDAQRTRIARMKEKRGSFAGIGQKEREYCREECHLLAALAKSLVDAHEAEGIELRSYYGPGSSAAWILKECGAERENAKVPPPMGHVLEKAYFGGRFELSRIGPVRKRARAFDIASAYPYALAQMPCMRSKCGRWVHTKDEKAVRVQARADVGGMLPTVYRYRTKPHKGACAAWGPLPYRTKTGGILFPSASAGGWAWHAELTQATRLHPGVEPYESWTWKRKRSCKCPPPFRARIVSLFNRRLEMGKTARGIVVKLALNSMYGKSAQRVGSPRFRCLVRAGMITAYTRGMLLAAVQTARDPWNVLDLATDSVLTTERLKLPTPIALGTELAAKKYGKAPLGAWEPKEWDDAGVFLARPGLRFPIAKGAEDSYTAARGIGTRILHAHRAQIVKHWNKTPMRTFTLEMSSMFYGAKTSITIAKEQFVRSPLYGTWARPKKTIGFSPAPKRETRGKVTREGARLYLRDLPREGCTDASTGGNAAGAKIRRSVLLDPLERSEAEELDLLMGGRVSEEQAFRDLRDEQADWTDPSPV